MWTQLLGRLSWATEASFLILENYTSPKIFRCYTPLPSSLE